MENIAALTVVILAAGKGTRMNSHLPKVLQPLAGKPLLAHVVHTAKELAAGEVITVFGHGGSAVQTAFAHEAIRWVEQREQLGTGHAMQVTLPVLPKTGQSIILYGDVPLIQADTLRRLHGAARSGIAMITMQLPDPTGYGRIIRDNGHICKIVEHKDASDSEQLVTEVNTGIYCVDNAKLHAWLPKLLNNNAQKEYYLTDMVALAAAEGLSIGSIEPTYSFEVEGVNDRLQLATLERHFQQYQAEKLMRAGVQLLDPARFDLRGSLTAGKDVCIDVNVIIEGDCVLGDGVTIGAGCVLKNAMIAAGTVVQPYSLIDTVTVGEKVSIGPFTRLRPGTVLANDTHIGNFVEVKNSHIAFGSKANHLAYIGDADIGSQTNIGAGTITCNYDGANKHRTVIGDRVFVGSNSALVAPIHIADGATVGAGSVLTKPVASNELAVARGLQRNIANYVRPVKSSAK